LAHSSTCALTRWSKSRNRGACKVGTRLALDLEGMPGKMLVVDKQNKQPGKQQKESISSRWDWWASGSLWSFRKSKVLHSINKS
jgi:hypothetical protein